MLKGLSQSNAQLLQRRSIPPSAQCSFAQVAIRERGVSQLRLLRFTRGSSDVPGTRLTDTYDSLYLKAMQPC